MRPLKRLALAIAVALTAIPTFAASPLTYSFAGSPKAIRWPASAFPIHYTVDRRVADLFGLATVRNAFDAWASVPEAKISFVAPVVADGVKAAQDGANSVSMADGLFANQGFLAVTTNWHDSTGTINEADIQIDPSVSGGSYNPQATVEHEVGHFLGLDHSAVLSAVMYPYVSKTTSTELDSDDRIAISSLYPKTDPTYAGATLKGKVMGNDGAIFAAQVVAVNDSGEPVATGLTDASGEFILLGVPDGSYRVYAEPLDGPVGPRNLDGVYRDAKVTSFPTVFAGGGTIRVTSGNVYGNIDIDGRGAPETLNPKWIGVADPSNPNFSLSSAPVNVMPGQTFALAVGGDGFTSGMTTFEVMNPNVKRISDFHYSTNFAFATFKVNENALGASAVVMVKSGNSAATLTGAVRIGGAGASRARVVRK